MFDPGAPPGIIRTYLTANGLFTLAALLIWAVNTLFLLSAGLDIFTVMVVNAAFTLGQLVFEVPTGVVADTIGRKASFLLGIAALAAATLLYVLAAQLQLGIPVFVAASVLLLLVFVFVALTMRDSGFEPRPLIWRRFGEETRAILSAGIRYGWRNRTVRMLFLAAAAQGLFFIFGFYSWQRYFLDLLGRELVWVNGVVTAAFAVAGIAGNALVKRIMREGERRRGAGGVLALTALAQAVLVGAIGLVGLLVPAGRGGIAPFLAAAGMYVVFGVASGIQGPVRQAYLNRQIPLAQRATVLSLDAFFGDGGASVGQLGLGWLSRAVSIPMAWVVSGVLLLVAPPLYRAAGDGAEVPADEAE